MAETDRPGTGRASDSQISRPDNRGVGERVVWQQRPTADRVVDLLVAYKWPLVIGSVVALAALWWFKPDPPEIPPEVWSVLGYGLLGIWLALPLGHYLLKRLWSERGVEIWDTGPATDDHRHVRIGREAWSDLTVRSPWGEEVGTSSLKSCTINGRTGYEVQNLHVDPEKGLVAWNTRLGEMSTAELRTYEQAIEYARDRLSRRANRSTALRANMGPIVREAVESVVYDLVRTSEESGVPSGDRIQQSVDQVLDGLSLDADPHDGSDRSRSTSTSTETSEDRTNGHDSDDSGHGYDSMDDALRDLDAATNGSGRA